MSIFNEFLPKLKEISNAYTKNFNDDLKVIFECFDKFEEEYQNGRGRAREKAQKEKNPLTTLQSINEDEDDTNKTPETGVQTRKSSKSSSKDSRTSSNSYYRCYSSDSNGNKRRHSNKRTKNEVDGIVSPEQDKRQKRNASVKAQNNITKQVNVNLTQKLRREDSTDKQRSNRRKDDDKENRPEPVIQIKQEKISIPPEPMDTDAPIDIELKRELVDEIAMPPPAAPVPKPRKNLAKEKSEDSEEESSGRRRTTRTKKLTDSMPPPPAPVGEVRRSTRASSRTKTVETEEPVPTESRPKRTRGKKKPSEDVDTDKDTTQTSQINGTASPAEKPRPKRTRRAQKAAEKLESQKSEDKTAEPTISPKEEIITQPAPQSPILQKEIKPKTKETKSKIPISEKKDIVTEEINQDLKTKNVDEGIKSNMLDETRVLDGHKSDATVTLDQTIVLPNGVYNHAPVTPKSIHTLGETFNRETIILEKEQNAPMDATVVLYKDQKATNLSEDESLLTDDNSDVREHTPTKQLPPQTQPTSAVKEKVQQFEEMASRVTRTKTRAMAKKDEEVENHTPPDKISKPVLSAETLSKMNNLIFNGKAPQISTSASKPRVNMPPPKPLMSASTSKLSAIHKAKEAAEESLKKEKEDARKKKEAMLEAKRELQKRKREEKMAAAAAAREAAERERKFAMEMAAKERMEKQAHADQGKLERMKEAERKRIELARKVAETEERRRAEEQARQQRLADEQRRADAARRKQLEEAEATKKEAALISKEIEKKRREYEEKQKRGKAHTPGTPGGVCPPEPAYMADGFQYLNSDEEQDMVDRPVPAWSTSKSRKQLLSIQAQVSQLHIDKLFSVRVHSPDLRDLFPNIERTRLKRTSSAVWRTPQRLASVHE